MLTSDQGRQDHSVLPPAQQPRDVIAASGVAKSYRVGSESVLALRDASISVAPGEFVCLTGASGSGKSTLLTVLAGIEVPDDGTVALLGDDVSAMSSTARATQRLAHIGIVFQGHNVVPELTAAENVALPLLARGFAVRDVRDRVARSLESVGVGELAHRFPAALSGGQRQRVGIARALAGNQEVLLADEPTGALDIANATALYELLRTLCRETRLAVLVATHDHRALRYAHRQVQIDAGVTAA